jgi:hypothetical protein
MKLPLNSISRAFTLAYRPPDGALPLPILRAKTMRCREKTKKPGDVFHVRDSNHYGLPPGLVPGTLVKLIYHDYGYWIVEANGEQYTVFKTLVDAGFEYEFKGRWLPADDPRVRAILDRDSLKDSRAYSCVDGCSVIPPLL